MKQSTINDEATIWNIFKQNRSIFPHIRTDYLKRQNVVDNIVFDEGVIIVNNEYKRRVKLNKKVFEKGTYIIHQIVNSIKGNGMALKILKKFLFELELGGVRDCILSVRKSNLRARKFYKKMGFKKVDTISWSKNRIKGIIYSKKVKSKRVKGITADMCRSYITKINMLNDNICKAGADSFLDNLQKETS